MYTRVSVASGAFFFRGEPQVLPSTSTLKKKDPDQDLLIPDDTYAVYTHARLTRRRRRQRPVYTRVSVASGTFFCRGEPQVLLPSTSTLKKKAPEKLQINSRYLRRAHTRA